MRFAKFLLALLLALAAGLAGAQDRWPAKPIRMVIPLPAGVAGDLYARIYANALSQSLGVPVNVDNKPGASGIIGTDVVAKSAPDGYTILWGFPPLFSMNPFLFSKLPYSEQDFVPIAHVYTGCFVLLASPNFPAKNVQQLVDYARANPGKVNFASYGPGSQPHLGMELIQQAADIRLVHVPYKNSPVSDLIAGQVQLLLEPSGSALPYVQSGRLRALAVTSPKRLDSLPDVPALSETLPGLEIVGHAAIWAPAGIPPEAARRLGSEFVRISHLPDVAARIREGAFEPTGLPAEELAGIMRKETKLWGDIIKSRNLHLD